MSNGTLAVSSLSTQEQAQVSGAVGATQHDRLQHPHDGLGIQRGDRGVDDRAAIGIAGDQHERGDHQWLQPAGGKREHAGAGRQREAGDRDQWSGPGTINGLTIAQQGSQVFGLDIENFGDAGVLITAGGNVQVAGCFIGTDPTGETAAPNGNGVVIENSSNLIGGPNVGDRNVISGNTEQGLVPSSPDQTMNPLNITPTGNLIENNFIGIDAAGTKALANSARALTTRVGQHVRWDDGRARERDFGEQGGRAQVDREHHDRGELHRHGRDRQCRPGQRAGGTAGSSTGRLAAHATSRRHLE